MAAPEGLTLELDRSLPAAAARVFEAFTAPGELAKWWGPAGFSTPSLELEPRAGAAYRIEMQPPEGDAFYLAGEYRVVEPPARLAFTFRWEDPDPDDVETLVDLSFRGAGDATEVTLIQGPFKTEDRRALHRDGWTDSFDKLEALLSAPRPVIVPPGQGHRLGNVEFLARSADTPRFTFGIIEIAPGRQLEAHVHPDEDDAFYIVAGELTFVFGDDSAKATPGTFVLVPPGVEHGFRNDGADPVRMLNIHAPAGFDRRIGLTD